MEETDNTVEKQKPWLFQPGVSGNPKGRPKGSISLKEYARKMLQELSDEDKLEFMKGLPKDIIWRMSEGNPKQDSDITSGGKPIVHLTPEIVEKNAITPSAE